MEVHFCLVKVDFVWRKFISVGNKYFFLGDFDSVSGNFDR